MLATCTCVFRVFATSLPRLFHIHTCLSHVCHVFNLLAYATGSPRVCNVFSMCLPRVSPSGPRHVFAGCLQSFFHVLQQVFRVFPLLAQAACSPRVCDVFSMTLCLARVSPSDPHHVFAACPPRVCNVFNTCFPYWPTMRFRRLFVMCLPRVSHSGPRHVLATCSRRVCNVFGTCLSYFTPIKSLF